MSANETYTFTIENPSVTSGVLSIDVTLEEGTLQPDDIWREKDEVLEHEARSMERWAKMSDEDRETTIKIVVNALDRLIEVAPEWVPASMRVVPGEYVNFNFRVLFSDVDTELRNAKVVTQRRIEQAASGAMEFLGEDFEPSDPELAAEG